MTVPPTHRPSVPDGSDEAPARAAVEVAVTVLALLVALVLVSALLQVTGIPGIPG